MAEAARLSAALDALDRPYTRIVEVAGEPGMGKTHLLAELIYQAQRRGIRFWCGRSTAGERDIPFHAFASVIPPGAAAPHDVQRMRAWLPTAAADGLLIVLDDFHWADPLSIEFIDYLVRWPVEAPALVVIAHRSRQVPARLRATLAHGAELGVVERIQLEPLSFNQSSDVLAGRAEHDRLPDLHRRSGGNPLYLMVLASGDGTETGADQPRSLLMADIVALPPDARTVALAAAQIGDDVTVAELAEVADLPVPDVTTAVDLLLRDDVLRPVGDGPGVALRHPVLGDMIVASAGVRPRIAVQRRAIAALRARGASAAELAARVERDRAELCGCQLDVLVDGAREVRWFHPARAERWLRIALAALPPEDGARRGQVSLLLGEALFARGAVRESRQTLRSVIDEMPRGAPERFAAISPYVTAELFLGHNAEARALIVAELADAQEEAVQVGRLLVALARVELVLGLESAAETAERALTVNQAANDEPTRAANLAMLALCRLLRGTLDSAMRAIVECAELVDRLADPDLADSLEYLGILGWSELLIGHFIDARRHLTRGISIARAAGRFHELPPLLAGLSGVHRHIGAAADAVRTANDLQRIAERTGAVAVGGLGLALEALGRAWLSGRDDPAAAALAERSVAAIPERHSRWRIVAAVALSNTLLMQGHPDRCIAVLVNGCGGAELADVLPVMRPSCFELLTDAAVASGHPDAERWCDLAATFDQNSPGQRGYAAAARGHLLRARGEHRKALDAYLLATKAFADVGVGFQQARMLIAAAVCAARLPDRPGDWKHLLAVANELARRHDSGWLLEEIRRCRESLPDDATRDDPDPVAGDRFAALTEREWEIARLVGAGRRTRDVAKALAVSPRTVDVHLTRIYRKLRIKSRTELARIVAESEYQSPGRPNARPTLPAHHLTAP